MSSGNTKARFGSPHQDGFRFLYVTSANEPFNSLLGATHRDVANAATDRLMSIVVPPGDAGVFGPLSSHYETYGQFTRSLEAAMAEQHGTAMAKFLRALVRDREGDESRLKRNIRRRIDRFKREVGVNDNNGSDVRVAEAFGLVYAAGAFAQHYRVLPEEFDCLAAAVHCYNNFRATVPIRQSLPERLLAIAGRPETVTIDPRNLTTMTKQEMDVAGAFLREIKGETHLLLTPEFGRKVFPDWNALRGTVEFAALNKANDEGRGRGFHCRIRSNRKADWFYCFRLPEAA